MFNEIWEWIKEKIISVLDFLTIYRDESILNIDITNSFDSQIFMSMANACAETGYSMENMGRAIIEMNTSLTRIKSCTILPEEEKVIHIRCEYCHTKLREEDIHCQSCGAPT